MSNFRRWWAIQVEMSVNGWVEFWDGAVKLGDIFLHRSGIESHEI